jgi:hypothetical protein
MKPPDPARSVADTNEGQVKLFGINPPLQGDWHAKRDCLLPFPDVTAA